MTPRVVFFFAELARDRWFQPTFQVNSELSHFRERLRGPGTSGSGEAAPSPFLLLLLGDWLLPYQQCRAPGAALPHSSPSSLYSRSFLRAPPPRLLLAAAIFLIYKMKAFFFFFFKGSWENMFQVRKMNFRIVGGNI